MSTRMLIIRESAPVAGVRVRLEGRDEEYVTDADGMVHLGTRPDDMVEVAVEHGGTWLRRSVSPRDSQSLLIVDIGPPRTSEFGAVGGAQLGERYEFVRILGRGGMGVVIEADDLVLERRVAIKMLNDELQANEEARRILLTEGRALAGLSHPNLVDVYDVASIDGRVFVVLEFVNGVNVEDHIVRNGPLDSGFVACMGLRLVDALRHLHERGIIHRDVKPANLMFEADGGNLKLIDFGLARSLARISERGTRVRGSPAYMAPEQIQGGELTAATDVYQVGVTLFEMLTGQLPFTDGSPGYAHVHQRPPAVADIEPTVDSELAALVDRCLRKDPDARPRTDEIMAVLAGIEARSAVTSPFPPSASTSGSLPIVPTTEPRVADSSLTDSSAVESDSSWRKGLIAWLVILGLGLPLGWSLIRGETEPPTTEPPAPQNGPSVESASPEAGSAAGARAVPAFVRASERIGASAERAKTFASRASGDAANEPPESMQRKPKRPRPERRKRSRAVRRPSPPSEEGRPPSEPADAAAAVVVPSDSSPAASADAVTTGADERPERSKEAVDTHAEQRPEVERVDEETTPTPQPFAPVVRESGIDRARDEDPPSAEPEENASKEEKASKRKGEKSGRRVVKPDRSDGTVVDKKEGQTDVPYGF